MSKHDPDSGRRRYRDAVGRLDRYRLTGPLTLAPGELDSPIFRARSLAIGARYLIWPVPEGVDVARVVERARAVDALGNGTFPPLIDHGELPAIGMGAGPTSSFLAFRGEAGVSLRKKLSSSALDLADAVLMARSAAQALATLHDAGFEHGLLRPATVFLTVSGEVRLLLAHLEDPWRLRAQVDGRDQLGWAAAAYLSPEQLPRALQPQSTEEPGPASDLWALGAVLQESLTTEAPFFGRSFDAQARSIANRDPEPIGPLPGLMPIELERLLERGLAKSVASRYSSARAMGADLESLSAALEPGDLRPATGTVARGPQPPPAPRGRPSGTVAKAPLGGALGWLKHRRERLATEPGPAWWQLLLPPLLLMALILLFAWIAWRA